MFYEKILRSMQKYGVRYLIMGGVAVNLHGVPRMTADLDIAVDLTAENVDALLDALEEAGLKLSLPLDPHSLADPEERSRWREEKHLEALTFQSVGSEAPYREVDIVLEPPLDFGEMYAARVELQADDIKISLISLPHLIELKQAIGRKQDIADVESLKKAEAEEGE
ncbi:MAG: hypothetical protein JJD96_00740 [Thermoleophilia bacterium]|nr:hypothetical protein [Thermoleophilia bacterium]